MHSKFHFKNQIKKRASRQLTDIINNPTTAKKKKKNQKKTDKRKIYSKKIIKTTLSANRRLICKQT